MLPPLGVYLSAFDRMLSNTARNRSGSATIRGRICVDRDCSSEMPCAFACPSIRLQASATTAATCTGSRLSRSSPASMRVRSRNSWTVSVSCSTPINDVATSSRSRSGSRSERFLQHQQRHPQRRQRRLELVRGDGDELRAHLVEAHQVGDVVQEQDRTALLRVQRRNRHDARQQALDCAVLFDANRSRQVGPADMHAGPAAIALRRHRDPARRGADRRATVARAHRRARALSRAARFID